MVTDCTDAAIFQISNVNTNGNIAHNTGVGVPGNSSKALGKRYTGGELIGVRTAAYFIKANASGIPSLYRVRNGVTEELVEGIEGLQVSFGDDTDSNGSIDQYVKANAVSDWENVVAVKIELLGRSLRDNLLADDQKQSYYFNSSTVNATDRRLRKVFSAVVVVRNRLS
jgi:type IV pilus assembly protein PilW